MLQLSIQGRTSRIGLVLRDLRAIIVALFRSLLTQDIFRMIAGPRGKIRDF